MDTFWNCFRNHFIIFSRSLAITVRRTNKFRWFHSFSSSGVEVNASSYRCNISMKNTKQASASFAWWIKSISYIPGKLSFEITGILVQYVTILIVFIPLLSLWNAFSESHSFFRCLKFWRLTTFCRRENKIKGIKRYANWRRNLNGMRFDCNAIICSNPNFERYLTLWWISLQAPACLYQMTYTIFLRNRSSQPYWRSSATAPWRFGIRKRAVKCLET